MTGKLVLISITICIIMLLIKNSFNKDFYDIRSLGVSSKSTNDNNDNNKVAIFTNTRFYGEDIKTIDTGLYDGYYLQQNCLNECNNQNNKTNSKKCIGFSTNPASGKCTLFNTIVKNMSGSGASYKMII